MKEPNLFFFKSSDRPKFGSVRFGSGSGFGSDSDFGSGHFSVPVSGQFFYSNFGSIPVSTHISVPVDHYSKVTKLLYLYRYFTQLVN